jgi:hypothetical protein
MRYAVYCVETKEETLYPTLVSVNEAIGVPITHINEHLMLDTRRKLLNGCLVQRCDDFMADWEDIPRV